MTSDPAPAPPLDAPRVPRPRPTWFTAVVALIGVLGVGGYGVMAATDYELGSPERDEIPASVRSSPGGYRSFHFWHSGYHGGK